MVNKEIIVTKQELKSKVKCWPIYFRNWWKSFCKFLRRNLDLLKIQKIVKNIIMIKTKKRIILMNKIGKMCYWNKKV